MLNTLDMSDRAFTAADRHIAGRMSSCRAKPAATTDPDGPRVQADRTESAGAYFFGSTSAWYVSAWERCS